MMIDEAELNTMNVVHSCARAANPHMTCPARTCGLVGTQQMKDHGNEHPAAGQAATQSA